MSDATQPHHGTDPVQRALFWCVVVPMVLLVFGLCVLPQAVFRLSYGRGPLTVGIHHVHSGMTPAEVVDLLGPPHETRPDSETWVYFTDAFTFGCCSVDFGQDGRVENTHEPW